MIRRPMLAGIALSCLVCGACHDSAPPANAAAVAAISEGDGAAPASSADTVIHAEDDGKSFDVARGASVTFMLPSNAGTGYVWVPTQVDDGVLLQQGERTSDVSSDVPGAPKMDVYHFTAATSGTTTVEMSLRRPFGTGAAARAVRVTVHVR